MCDPSVALQIGFYFVFLAIVAIPFTVLSYIIRTERMTEVLGKTVPYGFSLQWFFGYMVKFWVNETSGKDTGITLHNFKRDDLKKVGLLFGVMWFTLYFVISTSMWLLWREVCWDESAIPIYFIIGSVIFAACWTPAFFIWFWEYWLFAFVLNAIAFLLALCSLIWGAIVIQELAPFATLMVLYTFVLGLAMWSTILQPFAMWDRFYEGSIARNPDAYTTMDGSTFLLNSDEFNVRLYEPIFRFEQCNQFECTDRMISTSSSDFDANRRTVLQSDIESKGLD